MTEIELLVFTKALGTTWYNMFLILLRVNNLHYIPD